jgi:hypothetical protein
VVLLKQFHRYPKCRDERPEQKRPLVIPNETVEVKNKRRSERVILRVAVVVSVGTYDGNVMSEPTFTQVVNAHGGLLILKMELFARQKFVLKNLKMGIARECSQNGKVCHQRIPGCLSIRNTHPRFLADHISSKGLAGSGSLSGGGCPRFAF